ncbi:hypothetical protein [Collinsella bouchesdurhonensis]|uniref:hypothetical protein n=1 Tax=Collinsella bouchesdurhonensis TaxID=1907654 RepID=UPI00356B2AB9
MSSTTARSISIEASSHGLIDIASLILLAILLATGFILNMTAGNALAMTGIKPQFIIAAYALAIALTRATLAQSIVYGLISAAVIQFTTSIPGLNFLTEAAGALTMAVLVKSSIGGAKVNALIATFVTPPLSLAPCSLSRERSWRALDWRPRCLKSPWCWELPSSTPLWSKRCSSPLPKQSKNNLGGVHCPARGYLHRCPRAR